MDSIGPIEAVLIVVWLVIVLYCAYLTAKKGHWIMFILGFFCGGIFWVIGAILPDSRPGRV